MKKFANLASLAVGAILCAVLVGYGITAEVPLGALNGRVVMHENGRVLPGATIVITPLADDIDASSKPRTVQVKPDGTFSLRNMPAGGYMIEASAKAHTLKNQSVVVAEGAPTYVDLEMDAAEPYLNLYESQRIYTPDERPAIEVRGFTPEDTVDFTIKKLDLDRIVKAGGLYNALQQFSSYRDADATQVGKLPTARQDAHKIKSRDLEGTYIEQVDFDRLPEGFYWVQASAGKLTKGSWMSVSHIALIAKHTPTDAVCFVTDVKSGIPIPNVPIKISKQSGLADGGKTDGSGVLKVHLPGGPDDNSAILLASVGGSNAIVSFQRYRNEESAGSGTVFMYSDRPIYRPGDQVFYKGIVRSLKGWNYEMAAIKEAKIEIRDADDSLFATKTLPLDAHGAFHGDFSLNKEAKPGNYRVIATVGGLKNTLDVSVAAYRKPEFTITVKPQQPYYILGQRAKATVKCEYYFGGPVVGAKVSASILRSPHWDWGGPDEGDASDEASSYDGYSGGGGEEVANQKAVTDANGEAVIEFDTEPSKKGWETNVDYDYNVSVSVAESSEKSFEGSGTVKVTRGAYSLTVSPDNYLAAPGSQIPTKIAVLSHDTPPKPMAGVQVHVDYGTDIWTRNTSVFKKTGSVTGVTGPDGLAVVVIPAREPGSLVIKASADDREGHSIEAQGYVYIEGGTEAKLKGKLTLTLDKKAYNIGESTKALIQTDAPGGSALVTVESDRVHMIQVVPLTQQATTISLPVQAEYAPNAYVSIVYVRNKSFMQATRRLAVDLGKRKLMVQVIPDKKDYLPGESATFKIVTKTTEGAPVAAELSMGLVDESIYAVQEDTTDIIKGFYPKRQNSVQTDYSFPPLYLDGGDKGAASIPIRRKFRDTAAWFPDVQTSATGEASVTVKLPDNLTTWRATAIGFTDDTAVGMTTAKIRARKPLAVRLEAPAFMVQNDHVQLAAIVTNDTDQDTNVELRLTATGTNVDGNLNQRVHVQVGRPETVTWTMNPPASGTAVLTATARSDQGATDGVEQRVNVAPHGRIVVEQQAGDAKGSAQIKFNFRDGADANFGRMVLTISPSIASSMVQSLDELVDFPYGCVEQTMSRFMPTVIVSQAIRTAGLPKPKLADRIPELVADGYARLQRMQHADGGWGWWEWDQSDPFMTAFVLDGLHRADLSGFKPNKFTLDRGLGWAEKRLDSPASNKDSARDRAYLAYSLIVHGRRDKAAPLLADLIKDPKRDSQELALISMAYGALGASYATQRDDALNALIAKAKSNSTETYWPADNEWSWGSEPTAVALAALVEARPQDPMVASTVRYLMHQRRGDMWMSTRDTSYVLIGLTKYLKQTKELQQSTRVTVLLNGAPVQTLDVTPQSIFQPNLKLEIPMSKLAKGDNTIEIQTTNGGTVYYATDLREAIVEPRLGPVLSTSGLRVDRKYFLLTSERMEDGTFKLTSSKEPITRAKSGDVIECHVTVESDVDRQFILLEDPTPANCHVTEREAPSLDEEWTSWWSSIVIRDDRVAFFMRDLPKGASVITYRMRAEAPGTCSALPSIAYNMYDPGLRGSSGETVLEVSR